MMTLSEAALHLYIGLLFCVVVFSIVVILTVWSVHKKRRKAKQGIRWRINGKYVVEIYYADS